MEVSGLTTRSEATQAASPLDRKVNRLTLRLVTYGLGNVFDPHKFDVVKNRKHTKPCGGLWASPVDCAYGWREWCETENWGDMSSCFETEYTGRTLVVDCAADLAALLWIDCGYKKYPDYEGMMKLGIDAIYLTEQGERETRYMEPGLYGYDCACVVVLSGTCLKAANVQIEGLADRKTWPEPRKFKKPQAVKERLSASPSRMQSWTKPLSRRNAPHQFDSKP